MADAKKNEVVNSFMAPQLQVNETQEVGWENVIDAEEAELSLESLASGSREQEISLEQLKRKGSLEAEVTGGDLDDNVYQAEVVGEEAVGGQTPTPDQNVSEELLEAMGIASKDGESVNTREKLDGRDRSRWELDPLSSEDYQEHGEETIWPEEE